MDVKAIFEKYQAQFEALNARLYGSQPPEDTAILRWWIALNESGDLTQLITPTSHRLPEFYKLFTPPTALIYALDPLNNIDNAAWFTPVDNDTKHQAAYSGVYCALDARGTRRQLDFTSLAYSLAFEVYDAIIGTTWQANLLDEHTKLGYTVIGCIPEIHDQPFVYVVHLNRKAWFDSRAYQVSQRRVQS